MKLRKNTALPINAFGANLTGGKKMKQAAANITPKRQRYDLTSYINKAIVNYNHEFNCNIKQEKTMNVEFVVLYPSRILKDKPLEEHSFANKESAESAAQELLDNGFLATIEIREF